MVVTKALMLPSLMFMCYSLTNQAIISTKGIITVVCLTDIETLAENHKTTHWREKNVHKDDKLQLLWYNMRKT